jgi:macrolide transport system ATP-binding/permease protein
MHFNFGYLPLQVSEEVFIFYTVKKRVLYMNVMSIRNIQKSFGERLILENVRFDIKNNSRIGLVGYNGAGKTTLASILAGKQLADSGSVEMFQPLKIGFLNQSVEYELYDYQKGVVEPDKDFYKVTAQLGLNQIKNWSQERFTHLSGGEKLKLVLAELWNSKPNFLILDEPTNHLDLQGIQWLIAELKRFAGPVMIISHDRYFLDQSINTILEIEDGTIHSYAGNYSDYKKEKEERKRIQLHQYEEQQKYKQKIEDQMETLSQWSEKAHRESTKQGSASDRRQIGFKEYHRVKAKKMDKQIKSKRKRLEAELDKKRMVKPKEDPQLTFQFQMDGKLGKRVLEAKGLEKQFDEKRLFNNSYFYIKNGEKIGIIGPNGCGKSTLIKMILGEESITNGELWLGQTLKICYLSQDVMELNKDHTVMECFGQLDREQLNKARTYLANMGLPREIAHKKIETLSLGERTRIKLIDLLLRDYDVLILDEPTNHLDLPSREQLETTLKDFSGTILAVSHDYYFIDRVCDTLLVFEQEQIKRVEKNLMNYLENHHDEPSKQLKLDLMVIENRISHVLGELSLLSPGDAKYQELDGQFKELLHQKKELLNLT